MAYVSESAAIRGLASAVVIQAAEDYGNLLLDKARSPMEEREFKDAKRFLESDDLHLWTDIPGSAIMEEVERRVKDWDPKKRFVLEYNNT